MDAYPKKRDGMRWDKSAAGRAFRENVAMREGADVVRAAENYANCRAVVEDGVIYAPDNWLSGEWRLWLRPEPTHAAPRSRLQRADDGRVAPPVVDYLALEEERDRRAAEALRQQA